MQDKIYLLSIDEFLEEPGGMALMEQAMTKVDAVRREKAVRIRQPRAKAACLGAGLLLQLAVRDCGVIECESASDRRNTAEELPDIRSNLTRYDTIHQLLGQIESPVSLEYTYGSNGKPYLKDYPIYFNLSHSGRFVVCAVSKREIGVDIQEHRGDNTERIAKRYFLPGELQALDKCEPSQRIQMFFDLWAAKEAYGKYTGDGIVGSLEKEIPANTVTLQLMHSIPGYSLAVCKNAE